MLVRAPKVVRMPISVSKLNRMASECVVPYSEKHAQAHVEFAARNWPHNALRRDPDYNRWKFRGASSGPIEGLLLAVRDQRVVGQVGLTPLTMRLGETERTVQWASDLRVEPEFRIQGIGPMLMARAVSRDLPTLTDTPSAMSRPMLKGLGFQELIGPREMHLPVDSMRVAMRFLRWPFLQRRNLLRGIEFTVSAYLFWRSRRLRNPSRKRQVVHCRWAEVADLARQAQQGVVPPHVVHNSQFLDWRCARLGEGWNGTHGLRTDGGYLLFGKHRSVLYAFDWAALDWEGCQALFSVAWEIGRRMGVETLSVLVNQAREREWLRRLGFFAASAPVEAYYYPSDDFSFPSDRLHFSHLDAHANL